MKRKWMMVKKQSKEENNIVVRRKEQDGEWLKQWNSHAKKKARRRKEEVGQLLSSEQKCYLFISLCLSVILGLRGQWSHWMKHHNKVARA